MLISEQAVSPVSGSRLWVLVDDRTMAIHPQAAAWATFLRGSGRSPNTIRSYLPRLGRFLNWTSSRGLDWRRVTVLELAGFKQRLELTEVGGTGRRVTGKTVNASLVAVVEFYRFCAAYGYVAPDVAQRMSQPKFVKVSGRALESSSEYREMSVRAVRAPEVHRAPECLTPDQVEAAVGGSRLARDRFLLVLLFETGIRIGEALGMRRADVHLLPDSSSLGCNVIGAHVHVEPRPDNMNGARCKAGRPRVVPVARPVVDAYREYLLERDEVGAAAMVDYLLVNVVGPAAGRPLTYSNAQQLVERAAARAGFRAHPHLFRHTAATRWLRSGVPIDVVQALLGHASAASTAIYLHATDEDKRAAVDRVAAAQLAAGQ